MSSILQHVITLIGRILLSVIFISSGANHLVNWGDATGQMTSKGLAGAGSTVLVHVMLLFAVVFLLAGGLSVLLGILARWGAVLLIVFLIPATIIFHNFWMISPSETQHQLEMINFMKNLGLLGGLLMVLAFGSGGFSAEVLLPRRRKTGES